MSRWFRVYADLVDDPKFIRLGPDLRSALFMTWCIAASNDGKLPPISDVAIKFRMTEQRTKKLLEELERCGLIDRSEDGSLSPHNWDRRQYKSDNSTERVKRFRNGQRNGSEPLLKRPQIQITETDTETERRSASAPPEKVVPIRRYAFEGKTIRLDQADLDRWKETYCFIPNIQAVLQTADDYYSENPPRDGKWFFPVSRWLQKEHDAWGEKIRQANTRPDRSF